MKDAGADVIQINEPHMQAHLIEAGRFGIAAIDKALDGIDLGTDEVETAETVAQRLRGALRHIPADRLIAAPDCGMKYLLRDVAFGKLKALVGGAAIVRREIQ